MAQEQSIDVLMRVVGTSSTLPAESNTAFGSPRGGENLCEDFAPGFFCELQAFDFSAGTEKHREEARRRKQEQLEAEWQARRRDQELRSGQLKPADPAKPGVVAGKDVTSAATPAKSAFQEALEVRRKQLDSAAKRATGDFVDMQPVSFTRLMDSMSPLLFQSLVNCETLTSISVVKRKATGADQSGEGYLRLDFERVLLTGLDWKDAEHRIVESGTFIYRKVTIRYRPQNASGELGASVQSVWEMQALL